MSLISKSQNDLICNNIETNSNDSNSINNLIINNNNNNNNNNSFIQLSQLSTQGLPLNAFLEGLISSVGNNSGINELINFKIVFNIVFNYK
jgi:hypothetical protein